MPLRLSVNLSVQQLQHDSWLGVVEDALAVSGLAAALPRPRDHRERDHHAPGEGGRHADEAEADGRVDHDRRLRHRLLEPVVPRAAADPGGQDRPALRARPRARTERRGDHAGDHRAVAFARPALHRRGRRDRRAVRLPARPRLRGGAGLPDRAPARRSRTALAGGGCRRRLHSGAARPTCGRRRPKRRRAPSAAAAISAAGFSREVAGPIDVAQHARVVDVDAQRRPAHAATTDLAPSSPVERAQRRQAGPGRSPPDARAARDGTAPRSAPVGERRSHEAIGRGRDPRHVARAPRPSRRRRPRRPRHARLPPMPSSARGHSITALRRRSASARSRSPGRTTATTSPSAASRRSRGRDAIGVRRRRRAPAAAAPAAWRRRSALAPPRAAIATTRRPPQHAHAHRHSASSRNLPSFTVTSTRARSSMPLWLVGTC